MCWPVLSAELRRKVQPEEDANEPPTPEEPRVLHKRVNCQVKSHCVRNRTQVLCNQCNLPVCGQCITNYVASASSKDNVYFVLRVN